MSTEMTQHYDEGVLRAFADGELNGWERSAVAEHLRACTSCRNSLEAVQAAATRTRLLLAAPVNTPDPVRALGRLRERAEAGPPVGMEAVRSDEPRRTQARFLGRRTIMDHLNRIKPAARRPLYAGLAVLVAAAMFLLPPVRAAADQFLQLFRVKNVMFVPTSTDRIRQLENLNFDKSTLFVGKPALLNQPAAPKDVASIGEAAKLLSFAPQQPAQFPGAPISTKYVVQDRRAAQFQVNVQSARQLLSLMNIRDVTIPDAIGSAPITVDMPAFLETRYAGARYDVTLRQGVSPTVKLPDGVNLQQLGKAGLRLLGMDPAQADSLSRTIDWSSTLVFPFPADLRDIRKVTVGNVEGMLVGSDRGARPTWNLYWQRGERFYMLEGRNLAESEMLAIAESVR